MSKIAGYVYGCIFTNELYGVGNTKEEALEHLRNDLKRDGITLIDDVNGQYDEDDLIRGTTPLSAFKCIRATEAVICDLLNGKQQWDLYGDIACTNQEYWEFYHADQAKKQEESL